MTVTEGVLRKYPDLLRRLECNRSCWHPGSSSADLQHIPIAAGHVIVHYLFTGNYESLRSTGASVEEKCIARFTTAIQVYIHAHNYELQLLEKLASREVESLSKSLCATHIFRVIKDEYADPDINDVWFAAYLKRQVMSLYETPDMLLDPDVLESMVGDVPVTKFIIKAAFEGFHELRESMKAAKPAAGSEAPDSPENDLSPAWEHVPGQDATSENKESAPQDIATEPAPQLEPEPASTVAFREEVWPESEPELPSECMPEPAIEEDTWGFAKLSGGKKKKILASFMEPNLTVKPPPKSPPEMEPEPELVLELEPEPAPIEDDDIWGFGTKERTRKEKMMAAVIEPEPAPMPEPVPEPEPAPTGDYDFWEFTTKNRRGRRGRRR